LGVSLYVIAAESLDCVCRTIGYRFTAVALAPRVLPLLPGLGERQLGVINEGFLLEFAVYLPTIYPALLPGFIGNQTQVGTLRIRKKALFKIATFVRGERVITARILINHCVPPSQVCGGEKPG
jgi:hypothetical protein